MKKIQKDLDDFDIENFFESPVLAFNNKVAKLGKVLTQGTYNRGGWLNLFMKNWVAEAVAYKVNNFTGNASKK